MIKQKLNKLRIRSEKNNFSNSNKNRKNKYILMLRNILILILIVSAFILIFGFIFNRDSSKSDLSNDLTGKVVHAVYSGFSDPSSRLGSNTNSLVFNNDSEIVYLTLTINDYFIYSEAYVSFDGQDWIGFNLTPQGELKNDWIRNGAVATLGMNKNNLRLNTTKNETSENYLIIYTCSKNNITNVVDCHDGWQIINFKAILKKVISQNNTNATSNQSTSGAINNTIVNNTINTTQNQTSGIINDTLEYIDPQILAYCKQVCDHIIYPNQTYLRGYQIGNGNIQPGDKICIPAGKRKHLQLLDFKGSLSNPLIITNCGGQVVMDGSYSGSHGFLINNGSYFRVTGTGDSRYNYGIKLINSTSSGFAASLQSNYMEFDHLEISGTGFAGFLLKTDPGCSLNTSRYNFVQYNTFVHDNYILDTEGEGLYIGSSFYLSGHSVTCNNITNKILPHELRGVRLYNNIVRNAGWDCLQISSSTQDVEVYNNSLIGCGLLNASSQNMGMQIGGGSTGKFYNNYIENSVHGIQLQGLGDNMIYNNIIINSEVDGILTTGTPNTLLPGKGYIIENNLIVNASRNGFYFLNANTTGTTFRNNIIIGPKQTIRIITPVYINTSNNLNNSDINYYKFKNPSLRDYHYTNNSPMINTGLSTGLILKDFDGVPRPQGSAYDIGPFEYIQSSVVQNSSNSSNLSSNVSTNPIINSCGCNFVISLSGAEWEFNGFTKGVKPGDKICFSNGNRTGFAFVNVRGTSANPIVITNMCNGTTNITAPSQWGNAFSVTNSSNIRVTGSGNPSVKYGIKITGATMGINFFGFTTDFEVDHLNITAVGSSALVAKTDPTCNPATLRGNFIMKNILIHDNFILTTIDEGMYIGNSHYDYGLDKYCSPTNLASFANCGGTMTCTGTSCSNSTGCQATLVHVDEHDVDNVKIYNNVLRDIGNEGIQVGSTTNLILHDNFVYNAGRLYHGQHQNGYQLGSGTAGAFVYNNYLDGATGMCVLDGGGGNTYYNNIFMNCGMSGMQLQDTSTSYESKGFMIVNNIFINPGNEGIFIYSENPAQSYFANNIVVTNRSISPQEWNSTGFRFIAYNYKPRINLIVANNINTSNLSYLKFVNPSLKDFHLQSNSPAIDKGLDPSTYGFNVYDDYDGISRPRNNGYDIGPFEFTGTPAVVANPSCSQEQAGYTDYAGSGYPSYDHPYTVWVSSTYNTDCSKRWPLIIFLHGVGESGVANGSQLSLVKNQGLMTQTSSGRLNRFVVVAPQNTGGWFSDPAMIDEVIEKVKSRYRIDDTRIYITGLSAGATGTWDYAEAYPNKVAAIIPIARGGEQPLNSSLCVVSNIPIWAFHGSTDGLISYSQQTYLNTQCNPVANPRYKLTIYPGVGHNAWDRTYSLSGMGSESTSYDRFNISIYDWLLHYSTLNKSTNTPVSIDSDSDGYSSTADCNDNSASVWRYLNGFVDSDSDSYTIGSSQQICSGSSLPAGYRSTSSGTDCNDNNININPGKTEICGNGIDDDCSNGDLTCTVVASCSDGIMNGIETGIDCGGSCSACFVAPTCSDGIMNGVETGIDCGGSCNGCIVSNPSPTLPSGVLFSYPFTTNANDVSGNGRDGIVVGATWSALGSSGVYTFDGNDYITVGNGNSLDGFTGLSVEVWTYNPVLQDHEYLISKRRDSNSPWGLYAHTNGYWNFIINSTSGVSTPVLLNEWDYIVGTWNGSIAKIYINGVLKNSYATTPMPSFPVNNLVIGAREAGTNKVYFYQGQIGEVHAYNRPLSQSEITSRYDETKIKYQ